MDRNWQKKEYYEIRIKGHLASFRSETFDGMQIDLSPNGETTLRGFVVDQAALHGLLARIRDLNLILISVNWIQPGPFSSAMPGTEKNSHPSPSKT
jgi:hypothetical protein